MKKLSLLVGGLILSTAVMAQKPSADVPMTLEGQLGYNASTLSFTAPSVRFRYFLTDNIAARVTLGINATSSTDYVYETPGDLTSPNGEVSAKSNAWNAAIGAEYHFAGTDRLSPYAGLDIMFGGAKDTDEGTDVDFLTGTYEAGSSYTIEDPSSLFGVALVFGTDFYFAENFYVGLEMGMAWTNYTTKAGSFEITDVAGGVTTTTSGDLNAESKDAFFTTGAMPAALIPTGNIRLGWRF